MKNYPAKSKNSILKRLLMFMFCSIIASNIYSQTIIEMENINGVFHIPCKVNDIPMKFVFDTGASNVSISSTEAMFLIKQGLIKRTDFIEMANYQIASGDIIEGTRIYLRKIKIGEFVMEDVIATIIHQQNAPLLLGQSAISKLGSYTVSENKLIFGYSNNELYSYVVDTVAGSRRNYIPKLSHINQFIKEENGYKSFVLKEDGVNEAWIKWVNPQEKKKDAKGKTYFVNGRCQVQYLEFDCEGKKLRCSSILYFDNKDFLTAAFTDILSEFSSIYNLGVHDEYIEIFNFICK